MMSRSGSVRLQREQLGHHVVGRRVVDLHAEEDDALLEELVVRVGLLDPVARALDEGRQDVARLRERHAVGKLPASWPAAGGHSFSRSCSGLVRDAGRRCRCRSRRGRAHDVVDEAVLLGLLRGEPAVAVGVGLDLLDRLAGVQAISSAISRLAGVNMLGLDGDVGRGAADAGRRAGASGSARAAARTACPGRPR